MVVYGLSGLVQRWSIKCFKKVATWATFDGKNDEENEQPFFLLFR